MRNVNFADKVEIPAKSGVSGGTLAVVPNQVGIAVFSPRLDAHGSSVRGIKVCEDIAREFELHMFDLPMGCSHFRQTLANDS